MYTLVNWTIHTLQEMVSEWSVWQWGRAYIWYQVCAAHKPDRGNALGLAIPTLALAATCVQSPARALWQLPFVPVASHEPLVLSCSIACSSPHSAVSFHGNTRYERNQRNDIGIRSSTRRTRGQRLHCCRHGTRVRITMASRNVASCPAPIPHLGISIR